MSHPRHARRRRLGFWGRLLLLAATFLALVCLVLGIVGAVEVLHELRAFSLRS